ncbi:hypothetical protein FH972_025905 [Carpinus fangiana]|uniref:Uncharacterized protein n=1 Tax=Carpinus fangiana TaxID=176857 RepID=A0A5N6L2C9_9ROSI|nr:hypothetical protein FH972_025905 [Carpinus fangiana]
MSSWPVWMKPRLTHSSISYSALHQDELPNGHPSNAAPSHMHVTSQPGRRRGWNRMLTVLVLMLLGVVIFQPTQSTQPASSANDAIIPPDTFKDASLHKQTHPKPDTHSLARPNPNLDAPPATDAHPAKPDTHSRVRPQTDAAPHKNSSLHGHADAPARKLHLLLPATTGNANMCKTLFTAAAMGYPTPVLINWGEQPKPGEKIVSHLEKVYGIANYLATLGPEAADDLVLIADTFDVWFNLPVNTLLSRYDRVIADENEYIAQLWGRPALDNGVRATTVFASDKACFGFFPETYWCYLQPESSLPTDLYGDKTDKEDAGFGRYGSMRPRYLNSGIILGPVYDVLAIFQRAEDFMKDLKIDNKFFWQSDQRVLAMVFAEQQLMRTRKALDNPQWRDGNTEAAENRTTPGSDPRYSPNLSLHHEFNNLTLTNLTFQKGEVNMGYEHGITIDVRSLLSQTTAASNHDWAYLYYDRAYLQRVPDLSDPRNCIPHVRENIPEELASLPVPYASIVAEKRIHLNANGITWSDLPLYTNLCTGEIPAIIHHNGDKSMREKQWPSLWLTSAGQEILAAIKARSKDEPGKSVNTGGAMTDHGEKLSWDQLCKAEEQGIFVDELNIWNPGTMMYGVPPECVCSNARTKISPLICMAVDFAARQWPDIFTEHQLGFGRSGQLFSGGWMDIKRDGRQSRARHGFPQAVRAGSALVYKTHPSGSLLRSSLTILARRLDPAAQPRLLNYRCAARNRALTIPPPAPHLADPRLAEFIDSVHSPAPSVPHDQSSATAPSRPEREGQARRIHRPHPLLCTVRPASSSSSSHSALHTNTTSHAAAAPDPLTLSPFQIFRRRIRVPARPAAEEYAQGNPTRLLRRLARHPQAAVGGRVAGPRHHAEPGLGALRGARARAAHSALQAAEELPAAGVSGRGDGCMFRLPLGRSSPLFSVVEGCHLSLFLSVSFLFARTWTTTTTGLFCCICSGAGIRRASYLVFPFSCHCSAARGFHICTAPHCACACTFRQRQRDRGARGSRGLQLPQRFFIPQGHGTDLATVSQGVFERPPDAEVESVTLVRHALPLRAMCAVLLLAVPCPRGSVRLCRPVVELRLPKPARALAVARPVQAVQLRTETANWACTAHTLLNLRGEGGALLGAQRQGCREGYVEWQWNAKVRGEGAVDCKGWVGGGDASDERAKSGRLDVGVVDSASAGAMLGANLKLTRRQKKHSHSMKTWLGQLPSICGTWRLRPAWRAGSSRAVRQEHVTIGLCWSHCCACAYEPSWSRCQKTRRMTRRRPPVALACAPWLEARQQSADRAGKQTRGGIIGALHVTAARRHPDSSAGRNPPIHLSRVIAFSGTIVSSLICV